VQLEPDSASSLCMIVACSSSCKHEKEKLENLSKSFKKIFVGQKTKFILSSLTVHYFNLDLNYCIVPKLLVSELLKFKSN